MTDFAALSSINASAPVVDSVSMAGAGAANMAIFGDILAETLEAPNVAAAAPGVAPPLAVADRQQPSGKILPEACPALPCGLTKLAGGSDKLTSGRSVEDMAGRGTARVTTIALTAGSAADHPVPAKTPRDGDANSEPVTAGTSDDPAAADEPKVLAGAVIQPRIPLVPLTALAVEPTLPRAVETTPGLPQPFSRMPKLPTVTLPLPATGGAMEALSSRPAGARPPHSAAFQPRIEGLAAGVIIIPPMPDAAVDPIRTVSLSAAPSLLFPASAVPGPALRITSMGVRSNSLRGAEPAQPAVPILASFAICEFDEPAAIAPLSAAVPGVALPQPNAVLTANPISAPAAPASRQDFVALVERLLDSRNASSPQPVHTALAHTEFGEISFRFAHDERGLSVAMASADPDFAPAVQAAMPAERFDRAIQEQARGQPGPGQLQGAIDDRGASHAAPQSRAAPDRNARHAADPDPGSREHDRPNKRTGIFA